MALTYCGLACMDEGRFTLIIVASLYVNLIKVGLWSGVVGEVLLEVVPVGIHGRG